MALKKVIGKKTLLMLILNAMIGTGIYFLPAIGARYSGTASILSWVVMSFFAVLISTYFAELVSMFPKSGGAYEFVKHAFGKPIAFVFGWMSWIISNITISMLIVGSTIYLLPDASILVSLSVAIFFILVFNFVSYRGIDWASRMLLFFGVMTVASLFALIIPGLFAADISKFSGVLSAPPELIFLTIYFIAETFFGWETATYLSEEIKNARKVLPKMLVLSTVIISIISCLVVFVALGSTDVSAFSVHAAPLVFVAENFFGSTIGHIFAIIIFIPLIGTAASWIVSSPRLLYAMSRDKILVPSLAKIHKKYKSPYNAIFFQTIVITVLTMLAFGNFFFLLSLLVPLVIVMYSIVMLSTLKLRMDKPRMKRHFNAPFPKAGPVVIILFNMILLYMWLTHVTGAVHIFAMGAILIILGFPLYTIVRLQSDKKFIEKFYDKIAFFSEKTLHLWYSKSDAEKVVEKLQLSSKSNVLDFGCGSGNTTMAIASKARNVVAVDLSEKQMNLAIAKLKSKNISNVIFVKGDRKLPQRSFDAVTAVGVLEHLDNPGKYVKQLIKSLKKGGRFYFLSFGKSFGIPGPEFVSRDDNIRKMFSGTRTKINIERTNKKFTECVHIYGKKN